MQHYQTLISENKTCWSDLPMDDLIQLSFNKYFQVMRCAWRQIQPM
jgi:hypothetical protein